MSTILHFDAQFLVGGKVEEVLANGADIVEGSLVDAKVFDVQETDVYYGVPEVSQECWFGSRVVSK
jgi:hypothetical protein